MIHTPTLFVLGAGASSPYGLPLGSELRTLICEAEKPSNPAARAIVAEGEFTQYDIQNLARTFLRSNVRSIDEFLARQPHLAGVGKALIAAIICARENPEDLFSEGNKDHWYRLLWNRLVDDTVQGQDLRRNAVRFISFNYDRSLESFLHESAKGAYGFNDAAAYAQWSPFGIMHVYGSVAKFSCAGSTNTGRPYHNEIRTHEIGVAAGGINIIPEGRNGADVFPLARTWFDWARHVYILGFGFDRVNCERLGFPSVLDHQRKHKKKAPAVVASVFGLTDAEVARARTNLLGNDFEWTTFHDKSTMTLREAGLPD